MEVNVFSREERTINLWIGAWIDSHESAFCRCSEGQVGTLTTPSKTVALEVWLLYHDLPKEEGATKHLLKCKG